MQQRIEQAIVVALMQADRRLVENVHHADQAGADLTGETNALRFAAGQRFCAAIKVRYSKPTSARKRNRSAISLRILLAISPRQPGSVSVSKNASAVTHAHGGDARQRMIGDKHIARGTN